MTKELQQQFLRLACHLSPENVSCDGELSHAEVDKRYKQLNAEWAVLEQKAGRKVDEDEVWKWFRK